MHYYEIWFYFYDTYEPKTDTEVKDPRTDYDKQFTWYVKTPEPIHTTEEMIALLKQKFPVKEHETMRAGCIPLEHYDHLSRWLEISAENFAEGCGCQA